MPPVTRLLAVLGALFLLCGCASMAKPPAGRGQVDSPLRSPPDRVACLQSAHLPVQQAGNATLQIGALPGGPTVRFEPTAGIAQGLQVEGVRWAQGAEVIGAALLYPHQGSSAELAAIESCLGVGVKEPKN